MCSRALCVPPPGTQSTYRPWSVCNNRRLWHFLGLDALDLFHVPLISRELTDRVGESNRERETGGSDIEKQESKPGKKVERDGEYISNELDDWYKWRRLGSSICGRSSSEMRSRKNKEHQGTGKRHLCVGKLFDFCHEMCARKLHILHLLIGRYGQSCLPGSSGFRNREQQSTRRARAKER